MTDSLPMLVGEAPSRTGDRYYSLPLSGRPARVLCTAAGIAPDPDGSTWGRWTWRLYEHFDCENLFRRYAHATPWDRRQARARARLLVEEHGPLVVVCLGRKVGQAFGVEQYWGEWQHDLLVGGLPVLHVAVVPHPSGLSRLMNDPLVRRLVGRVLVEAMDLAGSRAA